MTEHSGTRDFDALSRRVSNWGRWGKEDQRGTLNLVTPDVLRRAAASAAQGKLFRLGIDFAHDGPQNGAGKSKRFNPKLYLTAMGTPINAALGDYAFTDDVVMMPLQCATQWDGLAHVQYDNMMYNGVRAAEVLEPQGCTKLGIEHAASPGIMSRGILLDIARCKGVERLDRSTIITPDDLERACEMQKVRPEPGDILCVRTGFIRQFTIDRLSENFLHPPQPGLGMECALWLREHDVAAVCADNAAVEHTSTELRAHGPVPLPLHMLGIRDMGLYLGELFDFEALALDCANDGVYSFLLSAPALPIRGAVGAAINPLALK